MPCATERPGDAYRSGGVDAVHARCVPFSAFRIALNRPPLRVVALAGQVPVAQAARVEWGSLDAAHRLGGSAAGDAAAKRAAGAYLFTLNNAHMRQTFSLSLVARSASCLCQDSDADGTEETLPGDLIAAFGALRSSVPSPAPGAEAKRGVVVAGEEEAAPLRRVRVFRAVCAPLSLI